MATEFDSSQNKLNDVINEMGKNTALNGSNNSALKNSRFFNTHKEKTNDFFKDTRVDSCSHILVKNGQSTAMPFPIINQKGRPLLHWKYTQAKSGEVASTYRKDYSVKPYMHAGMLKKPLMKYDQNSYRSRLPTGGVVMSHKNKSVIDLGSRE